MWQAVPTSGVPSARAVLSRLQAILSQTSWTASSMLVIQYNSNDNISPGRTKEGVEVGVGRAAAFFITLKDCVCRVVTKLSDQTI